MVVKTTYRRRYVRAYHQMRTGFLRSTVYCTGDKVGVPHALKANRRMNNNNTRDVIFNKDKLFDGRLKSLKDDLLQISLKELTDLLKQAILPESNEINEPAFEDK